MRLLTELYLRLDATTKTNDKLKALEDYFSQAPAEDACWAVKLLSGKRITRTVKSSLLRQWAAEASGHEPWMIERCYQVVGDLSETLALIVPDPQTQIDEPLHVVVRDRIEPLALLDTNAQKQLVMETWSILMKDERLLFHKLLRGGLRVGVSRLLLIRALAKISGLEPAVVDHRLTGNWQPSADAYLALLSDENQSPVPSKPYPFMLAPPLETSLDTLGSVEDWQIEWKWDGIRAQLIRRNGAVYLWSRGEEQIVEAFPEIIATAKTLRQDVVLDGELLAWENNRPLPFDMLQKRLGRKQVELSLFPEVPLVFMAYDLLEIEGKDIRHCATNERRIALENLLDEKEDIKPSPLLRPADWSLVQDQVAHSRKYGVEGVMIKKKDSPYLSGRIQGHWYKWKTDPYTIDAVLIQGQQGTGRRAGLYTSYTFAVWDHNELVPITKAYSGLSNDEIEQVDRYIRNHTTARHGPIRMVKPNLIFEIAFEGLQSSPRHKSGIALRFPRMSRWRHDKQPKDADSLESVRKLLNCYQNH